MQEVNCCGTAAILAIMALVGTTPPGAPTRCWRIVCEMVRSRATRGSESHLQRLPSLLITIVVASTALLAQTSTASPGRATQLPLPSALIQPSRSMADGKQWTTENLNVKSAQSYCYEDAEPNCRRYGRLYTWESARQGCQSLGDGWRLPTDDEWRQMAKHYGGLLEDSSDGAKATFRALMAGGASGFNAVFGGTRSPDGRYERLEAHGIYWTASDNGSARAVMYNFGKGGQALSRHVQGDKQMALSVRCIRG